MKTYLLYLYGIFIMVAMQACNAGFSVNGKIENMPPQEFRVEELGTENSIIIDSGTTAKDGSFSFKGKNNEENLYRIRFSKGKYLLLALKNTDKVEISGDWEQMENYQLQGSAGSLVLKSFLVNLRENINDIQTMQVILDSIQAKPKSDSLKKMAIDDLKNINEKFLSYIKHYADTTQSVAAALFAVNIINPAYETPYIKKFYENITKRFPKSKNAAFFAQKFLKMQVNTKPEEVDVNTPAPDFSSKDPSGNTITLSSFRGKKVVLMFWASWCEPCTSHNAQLVALYNQYKDKDVVFLGVSLDSSKEKWVSCIKKDKLDWHHVSDLNGWSSVIARDYHIEAIPQYYMLDVQGNIVDITNDPKQLENILLAATSQPL